MGPVKGVLSMQESAVLAILNIAMEKFQRIQNLEEIGLWSSDLYSLLYPCNPPAYKHFLNLLLARLELNFAKDPASKAKSRILVTNLHGPDLNVLDFNILDVNFDKATMKLLYSKMDVFVNLEKLVMGQSFFFNPELVLQLNNKLENFPKLVSLKVLHVATSDLLVNINKSCPKLRELSVMGSGAVDDESVPHIAGCKNLRVLDIQGTKISGDGRGEIMDSCKLLEIIDHCPFNCDADFCIFKSRAEIFDLIKQSYGREVDEDEDVLALPNPAAQIRIKNFWLSNPKTDEVLCALVFPALHTLRLDFVFQDMPAPESLDVSPLRKLKNLRTLDLNFYDGARNDLFRRIIESCGQQLLKLVYNVFAEYSIVVDCHNVIARNCPNLESLSLTGDYNHYRELDPEIDARLLDQTQEKYHTKLMELRLGGHCTNGRLSWLLRNCADVATVDLDGDLEGLTDQAWVDICANNKLEKLEGVWFNTSTSLKPESISLLVDTCPSLRRIGRLVNLSDRLGERRKFFYLELAERCKQENMALELVWVTPKRGFSDGIPT